MPRRRSGSRPAPRRSPRRSPSPRLDYVSAIGLDRDPRARDRAGGAAARGAGAMNDVTLFGPADSAGIVSFAMDGIHPHDLGTILDEGNVAIRAGHHCAQPLMDYLGVPATARASFGLYSTEADVDALLAGSPAPEDFWKRMRAMDSSADRSTSQAPPRPGRDAVDPTAPEKLERKRDYLDGFLAAKPEAMPVGGEGSDLAGRRDRGAARDLRPGNPGQHLRSRPDLRGRGDDNARCHVTMTLTTPHCPVAETMPGEVELRVERAGDPRCRGQSGLGPAVGPAQDERRGPARTGDAVTRGGHHLTITLADYRRPARCGRCGGAARCLCPRSDGRGRRCISSVKARSPAGDLAANPHAFSLMARLDGRRWALPIASWAIRPSPPRRWSISTIWRSCPATAGPRHRRR
jgi:hypothetical protein